MVDQVDAAPFNRGALLNLGFLEARKLDNFTCFVFHDVDMVPETDLALYRCRESEQVRHNSSVNSVANIGVLSLLSCCCVIHL